VWVAMGEAIAVCLLCKGVQQQDAHLTWLQAVLYQALHISGRSSGGGEQREAVRQACSYMDQATQRGALFSSAKEVCTELRLDVSADGSQGRTGLPPPLSSLTSLCSPAPTPS
jgi:hypothetical protein